MKKNILMLIFIGSNLLVGNPLVEAAAGWESNLLVSAGVAESRLSLGQRADATNLADGRYDVPAMLGGSLQAAFTGGGGPLWRDIRAFGRDREEWQLAIAGFGDQPVKIAWDAEGLPSGLRFELIDEDGGRVIAMDSCSAYTVADSAAVLIVRVSSK